MPIRSPSWGAVKMDALFSTNSLIVIQHSCGNSMAVRWPWGEAALLTHSALLSAPDWSGLLRSTLVRLLQYFSFSQGKSLLSSVEMKSVLPKPQGS